MKIIFATLGVISLIMAVIGFFLPLLPTVPFVLLAAFLFDRSSSKMHNWITSHTLFGKYIRDYNQDKSISIKVKVLAIAMMWISMSVSIFVVFRDTWWVQLLLVSIAVGVTVFIIGMKTKQN